MLAPRSAPSVATVWGSPARRLRRLQGQVRGRRALKTCTTLLFALGAGTLAAMFVGAAPTQTAFAETGSGMPLLQTFYHACAIPLLLLTLALAYFAWPSASESMPPGFGKFQVCYLSVWCACVAADWLQGPYFYALYAGYGFSSQEIAQLFVAGFGSSAVFGCVIGPMADQFGRKKTCLAYCVFYAISCSSVHFKQYSILLLGRVMGGISTSILFSGFECWMVSEHFNNHKFSGNLLGYMFGLMFTVFYIVAIVAGFVSQYVTDAVPFGPLGDADSLIYVGGYCNPFDLAILCLLVGFVLISFLWGENYGSTSSTAGSSGFDSIRDACQCLAKDTRVLVLGLVVACFEGAMYAFVLNWTPALESEEIPPPHGLIFATFMMACMCGASIATITNSIIGPLLKLSIVFLVAFLSFLVLVLASKQQGMLSASYGAFLLFEFCVGVYFPTIGMAKSSVVPESTRTTIYNLYRVPLNAVVIALLLGNFSLVKCFSICAVLLFLAFASTTYIAKISPKSGDSETDSESQ